MKNKLRRLIELIQEDFSDDLLEAFKSVDSFPFEKRLVLISSARSAHQLRAEKLWLDAGKKRTAKEQHATAQADLAGFVFAYLTGDGKEYAESAIEALRAIGRHGEVDLVTSLVKR